MSAVTTRLGQMNPVRPVHPQGNQLVRPDDDNPQSLRALGKDCVITTHRRQQESEPLITFCNIVAQDTVGEFVMYGDAHHPAGCVAGEGQGAHSGEVAPFEEIVHIESRRVNEGRRGGIVNRHCVARQRRRLYGDGEGDRPLRLFQLNGIRRIHVHGKLRVQD